MAFRKVLSGRWAHDASVISATFLVVVTVLIPVQAQATECCFNNPRFAGTCQEFPTGGGTCTEILAYLNSLSSVGRGYCGMTTVRGGWRQVRCGQTQAAPTTDGTASGVFVDELPTVKPVDMESAIKSQAPVVMPSDSVLQVRFDQAVDLSASDPGALVGGQLTEDVLVDGVLVAPRGSLVRGQVGAGPNGPRVELTQIEIQGTSHPLVLGEIQATLVEGSMQGVVVSSPTGLMGNGNAVTLAVAAALAPSQATEESLELSRALIQSQRRSLVTAAMELTPSEAEGFWPLYDEYRTAMDGVGTRRVRLIQSFVDESDSLDDARAENLLRESIAVDDARLRVRRKYVKRFGKVLAPRRVARFYQLEEKMDAVIQAELAQAIPLVD